MSKRESEDLITWLDPCRRTRGKPDPHTARGQAVLPLRTLIQNKGGGVVLTIRGNAFPLARASQALQNGRGG